ncbi:ATP-binding protein [Streptomyces botrytidirepellens]|uniref:ATP-binding protein n=1 Tax=Streptomyces botrytidirepellens TaxID=2486417 RepID=A0A3M8W8X4_9ACTN|nr:ATP-binding protein [Streptomyces botrytidirepellens]RNG25131.1 ATP-binding protein [Streptomyces botrytidirepellens]
MPEPLHAATWRFALPHTTAAVPLARALIRNTLADIGAPVDGDTAELLTAELVANAVQHTTGDEPIELVVELVPTGGWQVEVHDQDPTPPGGFSGPDGQGPQGTRGGVRDDARRDVGEDAREGVREDVREDAHEGVRESDGPGRPEGPKRPEILAERGRGLLLIRALSADTGYRPTPYGKAVWFTLPPAEAAEG